VSLPARMRVGWIVLRWAKKRQPLELRREEKLHEEECLFIFVLRSLSARELKVVRCDANESHGLRTSPGLSLAWR